MSTQQRWQFCIKCDVLFYDGMGNKGVCPEGGGHNAQGFIFNVPYDIPSSETAQAYWRFCDKCFAMFYNSASTKGVCPVGGTEGHHAQGLKYVLPHSVPESPTAQAHWRFCDKCLAIFFDNAGTKGTCPVGGADGHHAAAKSLPYVLPHTGVMIPTTLHLWTDSLRCHSETPGPGIGEGDEPFVLTAVIDLVRRNQFGVPTTDVVLYGPLDDVDDKENHIFPFRPFWNRPFTTDSAIFITAILEHDEINPHATRNAVALAVQTVVSATAGGSRARIVSEALSAVTAAAEPVAGPALTSRLVGPPAELRFTPADVARAASGGTTRQILRYSTFGDYSVHYLARRN